MWTPEVFVYRCDLHRWYSTNRPCPDCSTGADQLPLPWGSST